MSSAPSTSVPASRPNPPSPASSRKAVKASASTSAHSSRPRHADPYYGHEETALMCADYILSLFGCPDVPPQAHPGQPTPSMAHFIAYALHRTRLPSVVTFAALLLLDRLKTRFPAARGSSGHRLFISAFMIASKVICDDTYSNQSWCIVGQKMFSLKEINQMEREMCTYLEWKLNVTGEEVAEFEARVRAEHGPVRRSATSEVSMASVSPAVSVAGSSSAAAAAAAAAYPSPKSTPDPSRPIRPVPAPSKRGSSAFPSPAHNAYLHPSHISPQPPALSSASSSLASSPASEDCKTPSPVAAIASRSDRRRRARAASLRSPTGPVRCTWASR
ncbi:hypothetical protein A1Q1_07522 [Trichosporon asahii var. asahii CBS 2479]|uniref:Cyclin N-terminal domain-containing protein n=1 Tax=Trichosporon asahii var. asahii (strain ATCC 90039 / CBS 2479 / JCM 2466 / KCTC 7840 / NBRC 103889/ NCYC 2677 / UAMH 7654) TaxID=1186058 RepID=J6F2R8_TRIAS|nr:hypothetical protein A1Q1_07522 [Trichosporon asahii var. asahii CBS 2479]EJT51279.1 hypothetical protein A1Q1_07522 [Trichosporon asahii var. asahii CBS 2479]